MIRFNNNGVPQFVSPNDRGAIPQHIMDEKTQKIVVGRYAYNDKCTKCGAYVHVSPDDPGEKPAEIVYHGTTFEILACPKCSGRGK